MLATANDQITPAAPIDDTQSDIELTEPHFADAKYVVINTGQMQIHSEDYRFKEIEQKQFGWTVKRELAKINYRIHTDAIKENLIPPELTKQQVNLVYASEAERLKLLNNTAIQQMRLLTQDNRIKKLEGEK